MSLASTSLSTQPITGRSQPLTAFWLKTMIYVFCVSQMGKCLSTIQKCKRNELADPRILFYNSFTMCEDSSPHCTILVGSVFCLCLIVLYKETQIFKSKKVSYEIKIHHPRSLFNRIHQSKCVLSTLFLGKFGLRFG